MNMTEKPTVILTFKGDEVIKETRGFKGKQCVAATKLVQEILKPTAESIKYTAEYNDDNFKSNDGLKA
jgi:hypothetical protein